MVFRTVEDLSKFKKEFLVRSKYRAFIATSPEGRSGDVEVFVR